MSAKSLKEYTFREWLQITGGIGVIAAVAYANFFVVSLLSMALSAMDGNAWPAIIVVFQIYLTGTLTGYLLSALRASWQDVKEQRQQTILENNS